MRAWHGLCRFNLVSNTAALVTSLLAHAAVPGLNLTVGGIGCPR